LSRDFSGARESLGGSGEARPLQMRKRSIAKARNELNNQALHLGNDQKQRESMGNIRVTSKLPQRFVPPLIKTVAVFPRRRCWYAACSLV
jgi:hypothetical protein